MSAYTATKEIKFGHVVDERAFGAIIEDAGSSLKIELKIKTGKYVTMVNYGFTGSTGPVPNHHFVAMLTRGTTIKFTVVGNVDWFVDESRLA